MQKILATLWEMEMMIPMSQEINTTNASAATTAQTIITVENPTRLRVRRVYEESIMERAIAAARESGRVSIRCAHGGSVANKYGYPADTEGCVAVAWPDGRAWAKVVRLPANKVSNGGTFRAVTGFSGLFDGRFSGEKKKQIRSEFIGQVATYFDI